MAPDRETESETAPVGEARRAEARPPRRAGAGSSTATLGYSRSSGAERQKRRRTREALGQIVVAVEVDEAALIVKFIATGRLNPADCGRGQLAAAIETFLNEFICAGK